MSESDGTEERRPLPPNYAVRAARSLSVGSRPQGHGVDEREAAETPDKQAGALPGGYKAMAAFGLSLIAYTVQTEFAQHVQQTLNYKKPVFSLYVGHSSFTIILPLHLVLLKLTTGRSIRKHLLYLISENLRWQTDGRERRIWTLLVTRSQPGEVELPMSANPLDKPREEGRIRSFFKAATGFDLLRVLAILVTLTIGITIPSLSWYCAVPLTSMADITALYNCFAVAALVFSVWFLGDRWETYKVVSVLLAVGGVIVVSYGGAEHKKVPRPVDPIKGKPDIGSLASGGVEFPHPFLGDMLALFGAVTMGLYEVAFKLIGTLPDETLQMQLYGQNGAKSKEARSQQSYIEYRAVSGVDDNILSGDLDYQATGSSRPPSQRTSAELATVSKPVAKERPATSYTVEAADSSSEAESEVEDAELDQFRGGPTTRLSRTTSRTTLKPQQKRRVLHDIPPPLPFGLHANLMTSGIGFVTLLTLWTGVVIAHFAGWEPFEWPHNWETVASMAVVAICGVFFNACFMILLSIWGPVLASVSCLLTTVLVELADIMLGRPFKALSLIGCMFIGCGFVVLIAGSRGAAH